MKRHADESGAGALIFRIRNIDSIMTKIDEDSLADQALGSQDSFSPTQGIRHDRQNRLVHGNIAYAQSVHANCRHGGESGDAAQNHRGRAIRGDAQRQCHQGSDRAVAGTGIENQAEGSAPIDHHRRPNASDLVSTRRGHVARLACLHHDFGQLIDGINDPGRGRRDFRRSRAYPPRPCRQRAGYERRAEPPLLAARRRIDCPHNVVQVPASTPYVVMSSIACPRNRRNNCSIAPRFLHTNIGGSAPDSPEIASVRALRLCDHGRGGLK